MESVGIFILFKINMLIVFIGEMGEDFSPILANDLA